MHIAHNCMLICALEILLLTYLLSILAQTNW